MASFADVILHQKKDAVAKAIQMGVDVNTIDEYGFSPLIEAMIVNNIEIAKLLIDHGADVNAGDMVGGTALHWAVENSNLELCTLLLDKGANPNAYTLAGEPVLTKAILREQQPLKDLLIKRGAQTVFAQDYLYNKLLGHRFELCGHIDIVNADGFFVELNLEGFILEFSLKLITYSLIEYRNNYAAKHQQAYFEDLQKIITAYQTAAELVQYQQYLIKIEKHKARIEQLLRAPLLIIPVSCDGHTFTLIRYRDMLVKCDRRRDHQFLNGIEFYRLKQPALLNTELLHFLIYEKKDPDFVHVQLNKRLKLELLGRMCIEPQIAGNCSWANIDACFPVCFYLLRHEGPSIPTWIDEQEEALRFYRHWREWDRVRALQFFLQSFETASKARQASMASLLALLVFQRCDYRKHQERELALKIMPILRRPEFHYLIDHYLEYYCYQRQTAAGRNFKQLLSFLNEES